MHEHRHVIDSRLYEVKRKWAISGDVKEEYFWSCHKIIADYKYMSIMPRYTLCGYRKIHDSPTEENLHCVTSESVEKTAWWDHSNETFAVPLHHNILVPGFIQIVLAFLRVKGLNSYHLRVFSYHDTAHSNIKVVKKRNYQKVKKNWMSTVSSHQYHRK